MAGLNYGRRIEAIQKPTDAVIFDEKHLVDEERERESSCVYLNAFPAAAP